VLRPFLLAVARLAPTAAQASAEIRVLDPVTGAASVPVRDADQQLLGWTDDGTALWVRDGRRVLRVSVAAGSATREPRLDDAEAIGPGGQWAGDSEIHAADGRTIARYDVSPLEAGEPPRIAWSHDGARVTVLSAKGRLDTALRMLVFDTATGALLGRRDGIEDLSPQAFAPDGSALLVVTRKDVLRLAVPGASLLERRPLTSLYGQIAVWSASGTIAIAQHHGIDVVGGPRIGVDDAEIIAYSGDGTLLAYRYSTERTACSYPQSGLDAVALGQPPHVVLAPGDGELRRFAWAPGGHSLAVDLEPAPAPKHVGSATRGRSGWRPTMRCPPARGTARCALSSCERHTRSGTARRASPCSLACDATTRRSWRASRQPQIRRCARRSRTSSTNGSTLPAGRGSARSASSGAEPTSAASPRRTPASPPRSPRRR